MKKIFNIISAVGLTAFSFYYTDKIIDLSKKQDVIMKEILNNKETVEISSIDAILDNDYIVPGLEGISVNVDKSYYKMKELGFFNENLYIFISDYPKISVDDYYDKFIIRGNSNKKEVALIFKLTNANNIEKIIKILNENKIFGNFFIDGNVDESILNKIVSYNHFIGNLGTDLDTIKYNNTLIKKIIKYDNNYCYVEDDNYNILNICKDLKMKTIKSIKVSNTNPYIFIKTNLISGGIYTLDTNSYTLNELNIIIQYIKQKGYNVVTIDNLLNESLS